MTFLVDYWDSSTSTQKQRPATAEEIAELDRLKASAPPEVPVAVPALNASLVLIRAGKWQLLEAAVEALQETDRLEARSYIQRAQTWRRDNKWVLQLGPAIGCDSAGLDQLFIQAAATNP